MVEGCKSGDRPDAMLFDFDGVIVDTEPLHHRAFAETLTPLGLPMSWAEYREVYIGFDDRGVFEEVFRRAGRPLRPAQRATLVAAKGDAFARAVREDGPRPYPGVAALLAEVGARGIPCGLCSGALPGDIDPILRAAGWTEVFSVRVTAADVAAGKPDPEGYRLALARLRPAYPGRSIRAERTLAIEDTPAGIAAARGAGLRVAAVATTCEPAALSEALVVLPSLDKVGLQRLWDRACRP